MRYVYLVDIAWGGIAKVSGQNFATTPNGGPYLGILLQNPRGIVNSSDPTRRQDVTLKLANAGYSPRFTDHFSSERVERKVVEIRRWDRDTGTVALLYRGVVLKRDFREDSVSLTCVDEAYVTSQRLDVEVDLATFPRAKLNDVGQSVPLALGDFEEFKGPVIEYNEISQVAETIDKNATSLELEDAERFPNSGTIRIGRELITYATKVGNLLDGLTRAQGGTKARTHEQGRQVAVVDDLTIGVDARDGTTTVTKAYVIGDNDEKIVLPLPSMVSLGGVRAARYAETPQYDQPSGELECLKVGLERDDGSTLSGFPESAFAVCEEADGFARTEFVVIGFSPENDLRLIRDSGVFERGIIKRVLIEVQHSGNKDSSTPNSPHGFDSSISPGGTPPLPGPIDVYFDGALVGQIFDPPTIDAELQELGCVEPAFDPAAPGQPPPGPTFLTDIPFEFGDVGMLDRVGIANSQFDPATLGNVIDGDDMTFSDLGAGGSFGDELNLLNLQTNPGIPVTATVTRIRFDFIHGRPPTDGGQGKLQVRGPFPGSPLIAEGPLFAGNGPGDIVRRIDTAAGPQFNAALDAWLGAGRPLQDIMDQRWLVLFEAASTFRMKSARLILDLNYVAGPTEGPNPITNHYDITTQIAGDWSNLSGKQIRLLTGPAHAAFRVYVVGLRVIYIPTDKRFAQDIYFDVSGQTRGDPATIAEDIWLNILGNSAAGIQAPAALAPIKARFVAEGYDVDALGGPVRDLEFWPFLQRFAREVRMLAFMRFGVLTFEYQELIAALPAASDTLDPKTDLTSKVAVAGADLEQQVKNQFVAKHDFTDLNGSRGVERFTGPSLALLGALLERFDMLWVKSPTAVQKTLSGLSDRLSEPFDQISFHVSILAAPRVGTLTRLAVNDGWRTWALVEILETTEEDDNQIRVRARVLID